MAAISYLLGVSQLLNGTTLVASTPSPESVIPGTLAPGLTATTITASNAIIAAANDFFPGMMVVFSGSMASVTGLTIGTTYYVSATNLSSTQFSVSATPGGSLITPGGSSTATPNAAGQGVVEFRYDQGSFITDASNIGGVVGLRPLKRGEVQALLRVIEQYLVVDTVPYQ